MTASSETALKWFSSAGAKVFVLLGVVSEHMWPLPHETYKVQQNKLHASHAATGVAAGDVATVFPCQLAAQHNVMRERH